jgi:hypothetical protein
MAKTLTNGDWQMPSRAAAPSATAAMCVWDLAMFD